MWLFQLLTYFPGKWEAVGSLMIPFVGVTLMFTCQAVLHQSSSRNSRIGTVNRPLPMAVGVMLIVGIIYLTFMGFAGAKPYGQTVAIPDRTLTTDEARGLYLYANRECSYCHQIDVDKGGHRVGPDLSNEIAKRHAKDYLVRYIKNPQSVNGTSIMPKYDLPEADLDALADFILSLDFHKYPIKTITRAEALGQTQQSAADARSN